MTASRSAGSMPLFTAQLMAARALRSTLGFRVGAVFASASASCRGSACTGIVINPDKTKSKTSKKRLAEGGMVCSRCTEVTDTLSWKQVAGNRLTAAAPVLSSIPTCGSLPQRRLMRQSCPLSAETRARSTTGLLTGFSVATLLLLQSATLHADQLIRDLREWLTPLAIPSAELFSHHVTGTDVARFYAARDFRPAWSLPERRQRLQQALENLVGDGLDPDRYPIPDTDAHDWQLCDELTATTSFLQAALHLHFGLIDRARVEPLWRHEDSDRQAPRRELLERAQSFLDAPADLFDQARPALPLYQALRQAYVALLAQSSLPPWPTVAAGPSLRPGTVDPRVAQLRARLTASAYWVDPVGVEAGEHPDPHRYDAALHQAVLSFQRDHALAADGIVGPDRKSVV